MSFVILASSDQSKIFVGRSSTNVVDTRGNLTLATPRVNRVSGAKHGIRYSIYSEVLELKEITNDEIREGMSRAGWGLVGIAVAGPLGSELDKWIGSKPNAVVAAIRLSDGHRFLGVFSQLDFLLLTRHVGDNDEVSRLRFGSY